MRIKNLLVVSACDSVLADWGRLWISQIGKFAVEWRMYDCGGSGPGESFPVATHEMRSTSAGFETCLFKPRLMLSALQQYQRPVLWLNPDTCIVHPLHDVLSGVDLAVTVRRESERPPATDGRAIDSAVVFANPSPAGLAFVEQWIDLTHQLACDELALNRLVVEAHAHSGTNSVRSTKLRFLTTDIYNSYYFADPRTMEKSKIIQFRGRDGKSVSPRRYGIGPVSKTELPEEQPGKLRIGQRGSGTGGWLHLDSHVSADIVAQIPPLPPTVLNRRWQCIEGIHVWEHFHRWDAERLARDLGSVLVAGGELILECPNLEIACRSFLGQYKDSERYHMHVFYGDPQHKDPAYGHRWGYTPDSLRQQLAEHGGFHPDHIRIERAKYHVPDRDFRIVATKH